MNERLCIEEVGVDLELCVHAHGHDVDPIMEASCNNNYFVDIISSGIFELILCNRGSDHIFSLIPFLGQVKALVFYRSMHLLNLYFDIPSGITPGISRISCHCTTSYELLIKYYLTLSLSLHGFWVVCRPRTPISESIPHSDSITLKQFLLLTSLLILQVIPSLIGYIIIVLNFNCATWSFFPEHNLR